MPGACWADPSPDAGACQPLGSVAAVKLDSSLSCCQGILVSIHEEVFPVAVLPRKDTQTVSGKRGSGEQAQAGDSLALEPCPSSGPLSQLLFGFFVMESSCVTIAVLELTRSPGWSQFTETHCLCSRMLGGVKVRHDCTWLSQLLICTVAHSVTGGPRSED